MTVLTPLLVAVGGAVGACLRWWGERVIEFLGGPMLLAILVVNLLGCVLLGFLFTHLDRRSPKISDIDLPLDEVLGNTTRHRILVAVVIIGGLGAFTTYSSFALEVIDLVNKQDYLQAGLLVALSLGLGPLAIWLGCVLGEHRRHWARKQLGMERPDSGS
ncbi:MAG: CrcB family protein [Phycisphaerales bacterium]|nr:CrcB family protein [Phycisphaerales bacterium]